MTTTETTDLQQQYLIKTYAADLVLVRGEGSRVWDEAGREYLDYTSGISVCNLGHCHPAVTAAITRQAGVLVHVSNIFVNELQPRLARTISERSFGGRVFFANSGAEANEGMIKFARKWGSARGRHEIVCMRHSFHGRTLATLAATDKPAARAGFEPGLDGFRFVPFNDFAALEQAITGTTAAVLLEPVQGEGGVIPAAPGYLQAVRDLCDRRELLLLFDEVQCGMGRCGELFAHQVYDVTPDAMALAKALANGYPMGAFTVRRQWEDVLLPGSHASTFGGTPLACAAAQAVFDTIDNDGILGNCQRVGEALRAQLEALAARHDRVRDIRGLGLMLGIVLDGAPAAVVTAARARGLLVLAAGEDTVRLLPPLTTTMAEAARAVEILDAALGEGS